jgi:hypothetical protein
MGEAMTESYDKIKGHAVTQSDAKPALPQALRDAAENLLIAVGMGWDIEGCVDNLRDALAQSDAEPVAWRWRYNEPPSGPWALIDDKFAADRLASRSDIDIEPLYAAPPHPDVSAGLIEAADYIPPGGAGNGA